MTSTDFVQAMSKKKKEFSAKMYSIAPGKIILTGEHAVVYDKPALVLAVNRYAKARITANSSSTIVFEIRYADEKLHLRYSAQDLILLHQRLTARYQRFQEKKLLIQKVMNNSIELIPYAFYIITRENDIKLSSGVNVQVEINIPLGCGMGSSAAISLSILHAASVYYHLQLKPEDYYQYSLRCEQLCHGSPSGVDPFISLNGGFFRFQKGTTKPLPLPEARFYLVLTGKPTSSTGECVMQVKERFSDSHIWNDFESLALQLQSALAENNCRSIYEGIRENHQLLSRIDVVPEKVKKFIFDVEKENGAAKISGAGSVTGDNAGMVLVYSPREPHKLCREYGYQLIYVESDAYGLRVI